MVLIPGIIKHIFFKKERDQEGEEKKKEDGRGGGKKRKKARLEQIGHRWGMQWVSVMPYHKRCFNTPLQETRVYFLKLQNF